jgi:hypothetical protein
MRMGLRHINEPTGRSHRSSRNVKQTQNGEEGCGFLDRHAVFAAPSPAWHDGRAVEERSSRQATAPAKKCGRGSETEARKQSLSHDKSKG